MTLLDAELHDIHTMRHPDPELVEGEGPLVDDAKRRGVGSKKIPIKYLKSFGVYILIFFFFCLFKNPPTVIAVSGVVINEFQTSPSQTIELLNISSNEINIGGYFLDDSSGTTYFTIPQNTILSPYQCIVFQANFNLNTASADTVRFFDSTFPPTQPNAVLVDSFSYNSVPSSNYSYSRNPDGTGDYEMNASTLSAYNTSGITCINAMSSPTPSPTPTTQVVPTPSITPTLEPTVTPIPYKNKIFLSEFMPNPSSGGEWVEIYNANSYEVTLNNWGIDDFEDSGGNAQKFNISIGAESFAYVDISGSLLNNDSDMIRLLDENDAEVSIYMYSSSYSGISWGTKEDISSQIFCNQLSSKGTQNNPCIEATSTNTPSPTKTSAPTKTPTTTPTPTPTSINYSGIYISEFLARADDANPDEWIEIYNDNRFSVTLRDWSVGDESSPQAQYFTVDIDPYRFALIELSSSRLNNSGDTVYLSDAQEKIIDSFTYSESIVATSWGRKPGEFETWCMAHPSKNDFNTECISLPTSTPTRTQTPTKTHTPTKTPTRTPTAKMSSQEKTNSDSSSDNYFVLGAATQSVAAPIPVAFTPRSNSQKLLPFSFSVNAQSNSQDNEYIEPDENSMSTLSKLLENPILSILIIVILAYISGFVSFDLFKLWKQEKLMEFED